MLVAISGCLYTSSNQLYWSGNWPSSLSSHPQNAKRCHILWKNWVAFLHQRSRWSQDQCQCVLQVSGSHGGLQSLLAHFSFCGSVYFDGYLPVFRSYGGGTQLSEFKLSSILGHYCPAWSHRKNSIPLQCNFRVYLSVSRCKKCQSTTEECGTVSNTASIITALGLTEAPP